MLEYRYLAYLLEGVAAVSGIYFYKKRPENKTTGFFAYFLLLTFFVESIGWISPLIHLNDELNFLKDSFLYETYWLYNPYLILNFLVYISYFRDKIVNKTIKKYIGLLLLIYALGSIVNLFLSDVFFKSNSSFTYVGGSLILLVVIFYYYFEILLSSKILNIKKEVSFYISIIALLYFLCTTPIFIYFKYFTSLSPEFVKVSSWVIILAGILMYGSYSIVFLWLANKKNMPSNEFKNAL